MSTIGINGFPSLNGLFANHYINLRCSLGDLVRCIFAQHLDCFAIIIILILGLSVSGCGGNPAASDKNEPGLSSPVSYPAPSLQDLKNGSYGGFSDFKAPVKLSQGRWQGAPFVEGGVSRPQVYFLEDFRLLGDLNGNGMQEAVVFLGLNSGGSGQYIYLAVVARRDGKVANIATVLLGDRVQIRSVRMERRRILVDVLQAGPRDAMCCPGELVSRGWEFQAENLKEVVVFSEIGRLSLETIANVEWVLKKWNLDEALIDGHEVTLMYEQGRFVGSSGCNRYFVSVTTGKIPGELSIGPIGATRMMCHEGIMALERRFMQQLAGVGTFGFRIGRLVLSYEKNGIPGVMLFDKN